MWFSVVGEAALITRILYGGTNIEPARCSPSTIERSPSHMGTSIRCPRPVLTKRRESGERYLQTDDPVGQDHQCITRLVRASLQREPGKAGYP
jgi:hypothetical protein